MRYGHFDDDAREYVITTPHTPYPWINYLGSEQFFSLISHQAGGYSFYRDAKMRRLTRYRYNNIPADAGGRYLYVNDGGDVWTPSWLPVKADLDHFEARHGLGYTRITGERGGLSRRDAVLRPARRDRRDPAGHGHQHVRRRQDDHALLVRRVLPVERPGRPDQLPAQPVDRRGRGRAGRPVRVGDLPHHRVPRAPRPLRRLRREHPRHRLRHRPRHVRRRLQRPRRGGRPARREVRRLGRVRLVPDRLALGRAHARARRVPRAHLRARLRREPGRPEVGRRRPPGRQQGARARAAGPLRDDRADRRRVRGAARRTGPACCRRTR